MNILFELFRRIFHCNVSRDNAVAIQTSWKTEESERDTRQRSEIFVFKMFISIFGATQPPCHQAGGGGRGVRLTIHLYPVPKVGLVKEVAV
jgi:hypothetical protein